MSLSSVNILSAATATGAGTAHTPRSNYKTFVATGTTGSGTGAATIDIEASLDNSNWVVLDTLSLGSLATTVSSDWGYDANAWRYVRAKVTAISGTGASVNVYMGC
jgi:hypothetical protein